MRAQEFINESTYDYAWSEDELGYYVTKDGKRIPDVFYQAKGFFDRSEADAAAKKHARRLKSEEVMADQRQREYSYQYDKPLSRLELEWVELYKKLRAAMDGQGEFTDAESRRWRDLGQIARKSLRDKTHPAMKGL